jgi:DNA-directed RNA polymerase specialized sigma24 family protein
VLVRNRPLQSQEDARMYLGRAIGNAALELYNRRKRERSRQIHIKEEVLPPANTQCPLTYLEERERSDQREQLLRLIQEGLTHLPMKQYEALRLTILESKGSSIRDIGATNGIPYSTLRHRSKEGLRRLRRFLKRSMMKRAGTRTQGSDPEILNSS